MPKVRQRRRARVMWMAAVNVTSELPFIPERYADLFQLIIDKSPAPVGEFGQERLTLYRFARNDNVIEGAFGRYTYIDPNSPWWDSEERKALVDDQGRPLPQVRQGIGPNFKEIPFIFFLDWHILVFDISVISPNQFFRGAQGVLADFAIREKFGVINLTVFPEKDVLDKVLSLQQVKSIKFLLTIPNPDVLGVLEQNFLDRMLTIGAGKTKQEYTSQQDTEIEPDNELKAVMTLASRNGYVEAIGQDNGKTRKRSTKEYPWREKATYDNLEQKERILQRWGRWFAEKLRSSSE